MFHVTDQEPLRFSKYSLSWTPVPDTLLIDISTGNIIHDIIDDPVLPAHIRNPQFPSSTIFLPPIPDTLLIKISTRNFQGVFLRVKKNNPWYQGWSCPHVSDQETSAFSKYPPFLIPHSWHIYNKDINTNLSKLPWGRVLCAGLGPWG